MRVIDEPTPVGIQLEPAGAEKENRSREVRFSPDRGAPVSGRACAICTYRLYQTYRGPDVRLREPPNFLVILRHM